jgi:hypothetical protein
MYNDMTAEEFDGGCKNLVEEHSKKYQTLKKEVRTSPACTVMALAQHDTDEDERHSQLFAVQTDNMTEKKMKILAL